MEFKEAKQRQERGYSVKEALEEMNNGKDKYKDILIIGNTDDNALDIAYSTDDNMKVLGYLEVLKQQLLEEMF